MSEMALTADHLIVIGRGRLIAETSVADFISASSQNFVRVRTAADRASCSAAGAGRTAASHRPRPTAPCASPGSTAPPSATWPPAHGIALHELSPQEPSLEEAFMELTHDSVEYPRRRRPSRTSTLAKGA